MLQTDQTINVVTTQRSWQPVTNQQYDSNIIIYRHPSMGGYCDTVQIYYSDRDSKSLYVKHWWMHQIDLKTTPTYIFGKNLYSHTMMNHCIKDGLQRLTYFCSKDCQKCILAQLHALKKTSIALQSNGHNYGLNHIVSTQDCPKLLLAYTAPPTDDLNDASLVRYRRSICHSNYYFNC